MGIRYLSSASLATPQVDEGGIEHQAPAEISIEEGLRPTAKEIHGSDEAHQKDSRITPDIVKPQSWLTCKMDGLQAMELIAFHQDIKECQNCPLGRTRKHFVFGSGNPEPDVVFVGEAPGADEDAQGLPFVGRAGQLLTKIVESTKTWKRSDVFICNVLKCRPPGNRTPLPDEVEKCLPYLEEQLHLLRPKLIMALGASAAQAMLRTKDSVGKLRNKWHDYLGIPLRVTYHPAALLRFEGYKKDVWEDMKELTAKYQEIGGK